MKKIALFGDSIRMNYAPEVKKLLGDGYEVIDPDDNGRFASNLLRQIFDLGEKLDNCDVIHFNAGEWDVCDIVGDGDLFTPIDVYKTTILRIAKKLKTKSKTVIFATTTPVNNHPHNNNCDIERYNDAVVPELIKMGIEINDLWTPLSKNIPAYIRSDDCIHLTEEAIKLCGTLVANKMKEFTE